MPELYEGFREGQPPGPEDYILSADEKTSIQARIRCHPSLPPAPDRPARIEHEYRRGGALQYPAAWDVRRGYVTGRCEPKTGIKPFCRLVRQMMSQEPYKSADRIFLTADNGSSHRGEASKKRMRSSDPRINLVHTPVHASRLNQAEIYFSIIQRKVLTPDDFDSPDTVRERPALYEKLSNRTPKPSDWKFDRKKPAEFIEKTRDKDHIKQETDRRAINIKIRIQIR